MCHSFCSKMFRNAQKWAKCGFKWVFGSTRKPLGNCSEIIRILVLAMTTADDGVGEVIMSEKLLLVFHCFTNNMVLFGFAKSKAINFSFKDYFHRSICNFKRLAWQKTIQIQSSSKFKSSLQHVGTLFNSKKSLHANITEYSMYWQKYKSQIVGLCSFNNF